MLQSLSHGHDRPLHTTFSAAQHANDSKSHLLLACSGSVATIKLPPIIRSLSTYPNLSILIILTASAAEFLRGQSAEQPTLDQIRRMPNVDGILMDADEWASPWIRGGGVLHIELRRWADIMVIAPLSANTLAKIVGGLADGLLSCVVRAWDTTGEVETHREGRPPGKKTIIVAPAMNTAMWRHPITKTQIGVLEGEWGIKNGGWFEVLRPIEKELACGDVGDGAMVDWNEIVKVIEEKLRLDRQE